MKKIMTVLLLLIFTNFATAQMINNKKEMMMHQHQQGGMMGMGMNLDMMADNIGMCLENAGKIGLSEEQKNKLVPIHREILKKQARFKADLKIAEIDLMSIMEPKDFDLDKAILLTKKISELRTNHHIEMLKYIKEVRTILTEEQYKKIRAMMKSSHKKTTPVKEKK
jgi:Spy/CpxP family protein refolding chaperone